MALVELKSDLSQINSFDQPDRNVEKESPNASAADSKKRGKFLDAKGDFVSPFNYSQNNKAQPIRKDLGRKSFENNNFRGERGNPSTFDSNIFDSRGNKRINFDPRRPYTIDRNSELLELHTKDNFLEKLYGRALSNTDELGIRKNTRFSFDQPFVIRRVDNRLGFGGLEQFSKNNTILKFLDTAGGIVDSVSGAVLGRSPNEFVGASVNSFTRTAKFLLTPAGVGFLAKQQVLKGRNPNPLRGSIRYKNEAFDTIPSGPLAESENLQKYNSLSLASIPGVTNLNINTPDLGQLVEPYLNTIKDTISPKIDVTISNAQDFGKRVIKFGINALTPIAQSASKFIGGGLKALGSKLPNIPKPNINISINAPSFIDTSGLKSVANTIASKTKSAVQALAFGGSLGVKLDKKSLSTIIDRNTIDDKGADLVNLVPYGSDNYQNVSYEQLDFIPFSFYDVVNNKRIVFRALLSGITDTFSPEYSSERYVGRPDNVYVYQGTQREISFTFDIYPKSDKEMITLWSKMNYLAGLCYPSYESTGAGGGLGMIAPFAKLTIGDMYKNTSGYISSLTYSVQDNGTYETTFAKLPKYIQANCSFTYIGDRLPSSTQKHYEVDWIAEESYETDASDLISDLLSQNVIDPNKLSDKIKNRLSG